MSFKEKVTVPRFCYYSIFTGTEANTEIRKFKTRLTIFSKDTMSTRKFVIFQETKSRIGVCSTIRYFVYILNMLSETISEFHFCARSCVSISKKREIDSKNPTISKNKQGEKK